MLIQILNKLILTFFLASVLLLQTTTFGNYQVASAADGKRTVDVSSSNVYVCGNSNCFEWYLYYTDGSGDYITYSIFTVEINDASSGEWFTQTASIDLTTGAIKLEVPSNFSIALLRGFPDNAPIEYVGDGNSLSVNTEITINPDDTLDEIDAKFGINSQIEEELVEADLPGIDETEVISQSNLVFPPQQKQVFMWWADGLVSDEEMMNSITYMYESGIVKSDTIKIVDSTMPVNMGTITQSEFPPQQKQVLQWWAEGLVSDEEVMNSITYLFEEEVLQSPKISVQSETLKNQLIGEEYPSDVEIIELSRKNNNHCELVGILANTIECLNYSTEQTLRHFGSGTMGFTKEAALESYTDTLLDLSIINSLVMCESTITEILDELEDQTTTSYIENQNSDTQEIMIKVKDASDQADDDLILSIKILGTARTLADNAETIAIEAGTDNLDVGFAPDVSEATDAYCDTDVDCSEDMFCSSITRNTDLKSRMFNVLENCDDCHSDIVMGYSLINEIVINHDPYLTLEEQLIKKYDIVQDESDNCTECSENGFVDESLEETVPVTPPQETVTADASLYRLVGMYDHFYTTDVNEKNNAVGYTYERVEAKIFSTQESGTVPLYRLFNGVNHFYLIDPTERTNAMTFYGYSDEGIEGYCHATQESGTIPLYRMFNGEHFYTTDLAEKNNAIANLGYNDEGTECFVYPR